VEPHTQHPVEPDPDFLQDQLTRSDRDPSDDETVVGRDCPQPEATVASGKQFGRYQLLELIGQGGMGVVYKARHESIDRLVALKILITRHQRPEDVERFAIEARAVARLDHPGIVRIHDVGEVDGQHYLVCELVDGTSLDRLLARERPTPRRALEIVARLAEAVDYAHRKDVIHRDLKPSNVLIDAKGQPRQTDFGLAHRTDATQRLTRTGQVLGTPAYMAPEQVSNVRGTIGRATDVHGLGAVFYELLTGQPPFCGENILNTLHQVLTTVPRAPHELVPEVPEAYSRICLECLAKSPEDRYPTAGDLALDCWDLLEGRPPRTHAAHPARPELERSELAQKLLGRTLLGCRIEQVLGQGAAGMVFLARHLQIDSLRAIKVLEPQLASEPDTV